MTIRVYQLREEDEAGMRLHTAALCRGRDYLVGSYDAQFVSVNDAGELTGAIGVYIDASIEEGQILGFCTARCSDPGTGRALLREAERHMFYVHGVTRAHLQSSDEGRSFYERDGYRPGRRDDPDAHLFKDLHFSDAGRYVPPPLLMDSVAHRRTCHRDYPLTRVHVVTDPRSARAVLRRVEPALRRHVDMSTAVVFAQLAECGIAGHMVVAAAANAVGYQIVHDPNRPGTVTWRELLRAVEGHVTWLRGGGGGGGGDAKLSVHPRVFSGPYLEEGYVHMRKRLPANHSVRVTPMPAEDADAPECGHRRPLDMAYYDWCARHGVEWAHGRRRAEYHGGAESGGGTPPAPRR